jgi:hypothetical protein
VACGWWSCWQAKDLVFLNSPFRETPQEKNQEKNVFGVGWFLGS